MKAELKAIPRDTVRRIYHDSYWQAAACPELPPGLALFHFDAAVNQGVAGAARMLQQAVGAEVDGEIGPLTLAAVASHPVDEALAAYAEVRRQRYRALPTFWRFGKGWLSRVDTTLALANEIDRSMPPLVPAQPKGPTPMPTDNQPTTPTTTAPDAKWWGNSMTIWGIIVTTLSTVLPALGPVFGLNITAELIHQLGDNVVIFGQAARRPGRHRHGHLRPGAHQHAPGAAPGNAEHVRCLHIRPPLAERRRPLYIASGTGSDLSP